MGKTRIIKILRKFSAFIAALPLIFSFVFSYFQFAPEIELRDFSFDEEGAFTILAISGLLEGEAVFSSQTKDYLRDAISEIKPQLVVLMGNNILPSPFISDMFVANTFRMIDEYIEIFESQETYFTVLFGDYDAAALYDKSSQIKRFMKSRYFVADISENNNLITLEDNNRDYAGNYRLTILDKQKESVYLYFIDTQDQSPFQDEQKTWIEDTSDKPSYFFSFRPLYRSYRIAEQNYFEIYFESSNIKGLFSGDSDKMLDYKSQNIHILEIEKVASLEGDEVLRQYRAKKIVLLVDGGLLYEDY